MKWDDRDKLRMVAFIYGALGEEKGKSVMIANRKFYFNDKGEIDRIIDYDTQTTYKADSEKPVKFRKAKGK